MNPLFTKKTEETAKCYIKTLKLKGKRFPTEHIYVIQFT